MYASMIISIVLAACRCFTVYILTALGCAEPYSLLLCLVHHAPLQDLQRACVEHAEAVFICCNKFALDPATEDRLALMNLLSVGQYLQER